MSKENLFNDFTSEQIESFEDYYAGVAGEIDKRSAAWGYLVGTMSPCEPTHQPDESLRRAMDNMPSSQHGQRITFEECEYILVEPEHLEALEEAMLGLPKRESSQPDAITSNLAEALFCALTSLKTVLDEHDRSHQKRGVVEMGEKALTAYRSAPKREPGWLPLDDDAKQGQTVILAGYVHGEWTVMQDDWYSDREMSGWREWPGVMEGEPTHYMDMPKPPKEQGRRGSDD